VEEGKVRDGRGGLGRDSETEKEVGRRFFFRWGQRPESPEQQGQSLSADLLRSEGAEVGLDGGVALGGGVGLEGEAGASSSSTWGRWGGSVGDGRVRTCFIS
jgi:hypothetical protein